MHRTLARQPLLAACTRTEIRWIRRWGDQVAIPAGEVLLHEDTTGSEFVLILSGTVAVRRRGRVVGTLGPGDHAGDVAILGLGPQFATVSSETRCELFVIGRRYLPSLALDTDGFRQGLFPGLDRDDAVASVRQLREQGRARFERLHRGRPQLPAVAGAPEVVSWRPSRRPAPEQFAPVAHETLVRPRRPPPSPRVRRLRRYLAACATATAAGVLSVTWHPPLLVIGLGSAIDVSREISVAGVPTQPVSGSVMLVSVHIDQPAFAGLAIARARGRPTIRAAPDQTAARRAARQDFTDGQTSAIAAVADVIGRRAEDLHVAFAPHQLGGPSASLAYAIALADLLDPVDFARGRIIAATGRIDDTGHVHRVGYVGQKAAAARAAAATLMLVPVGQGAGIRGMTVIEVATLQDALAALLAT
ncbi:MAG TPA: cyclic nucleotide-binding domain-containing protein [Acidimicrobiales bacterium]|nr:cyclic nucleotide-binding domain-containing protein [Acidimicrobiales bacterium]